MAISVLLVEDDPDKLARIIEVLLGDGYCKRDDILVTGDIIGAKAALRDQQFDLLLLDISLPRERGMTADPNAGIELLREVENRQIYKKPTHVIGITGFKSLFDTAGQDFLSFAWPVLFYDRSSDAWQQSLQQRLRRLHSHNENHGNYRADLGIVTALYEVEFDAVKKIDWDWKQARVAGDHSAYLVGAFFAGSSDRIAYAAAAARMGIAEASVIASKVISQFAPRFLAMTGVMGGVRGRVAIGDVIVAEPCWDYGSGKWTASSGGDVFEPAPYQMTLSPFIRESFRQISKDREFLADVHQSFPGPKPPAPPKLHLGPVGTGASVIANDRLVERIVAQNRKLLGIEMEAYGVLAAAAEAAAPRPDAFVVKCVSDFADPTKADDYQDYCAWVSSMTVQHLAQNYLFS